MKLRDRLGVVSLSTLGLRGRVRDHGQSNNGVQVEEDKLQRKLNGVEKGSRDELALGKGGPPSAQDDTGVQHTKDKLEQCTEQDHLRTWKDVVVLGAVKKR